MDSEGSEASGSFIVHSEGSGSVVVHDVPDDSGLSAPRGGGGGSAISALLAGRASPSTNAAAGHSALCGSSAMLDTANPGDSSDSHGAAEASANARRLPRPKPVLRWSQVPQESRASPASYLMNRYGRGGGGAGAGVGAGASGGGGGGMHGSSGLGAGHHAGGLGDSLDAFKLYVGDDGEMKMGDHHDDFYGFNYDPVDDTDDLVNLQHRQLSANAGGDFYEDTDDSPYNTSDDGYGEGNSYMAAGDVNYNTSDAEGKAAEGQNWVMEAAMRNKNTSRRRRLPPRRGVGRSEQASKRNSKPPRPRSGSKSATVTGRRSKSGGVSAAAHRSASATAGAAAAPRKSDGGSAGHSARPAPLALSPGTHVAAGAAAYPHLPASLGALVLLSPGVPTTTPLDKVTRVRRRLLRRQLEEQREYEKRQRTRHSQHSDQQEEIEEDKAPSPRDMASPRRNSASTTQPETANARAGHPMTDLKFSFEDLNRSVGPGTARMGAGASLAILRSARHRAKESPRLQEVSLRKEVVYVRADPSETAAAAAAAADAGATHSSTDGGAPHRGKASAADSTNGSTAFNTVVREVRELRDPYTGVVIPSSFAAADEQSVPPVALSCAAGITFFHDPTAPRPIAIADVQQSMPLLPLLSHRGGSDGASSREASLQTSFCGPLYPPTPTSTYVLPSSFQQPSMAAAYAALRGAPQWPNDAACAGAAPPPPPPSSSHGSPGAPLFVPTVHFPPPPQQCGATATAAPAAAQYQSATHPSPTTAGAATRPCDDDDGAARHERTETETYRDIRFALTPAEAKGEGLLKYIGSDSALDQKQDTRVLMAGEYRMPSAITGGSGQRQRWRLQGGPHAGGGGGLEGSGPASHMNSNSSPPPPWRWMHGPSPPPVTPFSAASSVSGGSKGGHVKWSARDSAEGKSPLLATAFHEEADGVAAAAALGGGPPLVFNLRGFRNACEANLAALRNGTTSSPRVLVPPSPHGTTVSAAQLPLYPLAVAPYAAPRNPLEQNIRYNAWTADGVSASTGAACIVHVFTITREMLRSVYEYVAYACAMRREMEVRERERARQRRMKEALAAGVLTRDLLRCLRCPHCGTVGQIVKAATTRHANPPAPPRSQPHSQTPPQLSQSVNVARGSAGSQHGFVSLRPSASTSSFVVDAQRQLPPPPALPENASRTERVRPTMPLSASQSPRKGATLAVPHAPLNPYTGGSPPHSQAAATADASAAADSVVTEMPAVVDVHVAAASTTAAAAPSHGLLSPDAHGPRAASADKGEGEGSASVTTTSPPTQTVLTVSASALPPLPPSHTPPQHPRLLSPTHSATAGDTPSASTVPLSPQQNSMSATSRFVPLPASTSPTALSSTPHKQRRSPTFAAATPTAADMRDAAAEAQLERSGGSRELSQWFVAPQPQRALPAGQPEFQRYATGSCNNSVAGHGPTVGRSSDSHPNLSYSNLPRGASEREESSVRAESRASDETPAAPTPTSGEQAGADGGAKESVPRASHTPVRVLSNSLPDVYMTPPSQSMMQPSSTSPNPVERTLDAAAAHAKAITSPDSTASIPNAANTLPPLALQGNSPSRTPPVATVSPHTSAMAGRPPSGLRSSVNGSFGMAMQTSKLTPAVPPLNASCAPLLMDAAAAVTQSRDAFAESMNAAANRSSTAALARHYVCQCCHGDVVPKTSMVTLPLLDERQLSRPLSEAATPVLTSDKANTAFGAEQPGLLAFEDLLQDDALVHHLQTYLQEALMLPAERHARPSMTHLAPASTAAPATTVADASASVTSGNHRLMMSGSTYVETELLSRPDLKSPLLPPARHTPSGAGAVGITASSIDAARARLPEALNQGDEGNLYASREQPSTMTTTTTTAATVAAGGSALPQPPPPPPPLQRKDVADTVKAQSSMPGFSRLSLQSSTASSAASSIAEGKSKKAEGGAASPRADDTSVAKSTAPQLLRLCVPCCGLKVSVLEYVKPPVPSPLSPTSKENEELAKGGGGEPDGESCVSGALRRRKSTVSSASGGANANRRISRKFSCPPPPTIPRVREDAATRGLTQSALFMNKESPAAAKAPRGTSANAVLRGRAAERAAAAAASRRLQMRRGSRPLDPAASGSTAAAAGSADDNPSTKTMMQDTDASKRHRVQVNARVHLDATSIDRIWERVFTQDKSTVVAAVAAERGKARAKRLKAAAGTAARSSSSAKGKEVDGVSAAMAVAAAAPAGKQPAPTPRKGPSSVSPAPPSTPADGAPSRTPQPLGVDLAAYADTSLVLKVELAYPRLPRGNVRQLLDEWVAAVQPHPVLLEAVIRNVIYNVLVQLRTLHAAGYTSGTVKSTNVFPLWDLIKATKEAGMKMPPRPANTTNTTAASGVGNVSEHSESNDHRSKPPSSGAYLRESTQDIFEVASKAWAKNNDNNTNNSTDGGVIAALHSPEETNEMHDGDEAVRRSPSNSARPSRLASQRPSVALSPASVTQCDALVDSPSASATSAQSPFGVSMPAVHGTASLATPLLTRAESPQRSPPREVPALGVYRRTSTKAPIAGAKEVGQHEGESLSTSEASREPTVSSAAVEPPSRHTTVVLPAHHLAASTVSAGPLSPSHDADEQASRSVDVLSVSDRVGLQCDNSESGSAGFPFSPALGMTASSASHRPRRGFSIDDSVLPSGPIRQRRGSLSSVGRRTHSAGPADPRHRRHSADTQSHSGEEPEELVPMLMEAVAPVTRTSYAGGWSNPSISHHDAFFTSALPSTAGATSPRAAAMSSSPESMTAGAPGSNARQLGTRRRQRYQSTNNSSRFTVGDSAAWAEEGEVVGLQYVRGAQLLPPARVLLPSLQIPLDAAEDTSRSRASKGHSAHATDGEEDVGTTEALRRAADTAAAAVVSEDNGDARMHDDTFALLMAGPPGAVPRPKSRRYSSLGTSSSKGGGSRAGESEGGHDHHGNASSADGADTLDPLQWSQQVMLVDNLGIRVDTALRLAMSAVLTQHPPRPARPSTQAAPSAATAETTAPPPTKNDGDEGKSGPKRGNKSGATSQLTSPGLPQKQRRGSANTPHAEKMENGASRVCSPREKTGHASPRQRSPRTAGADKPLNVYTPDLSQAPPPSRPVLFGVQEAEYVPAPEAIRSVRDETAALWRLWRQQTPSYVAQGRFDDDNGGDDRNDDADAAQLEYVTAQLAEQGCPTTTLRNTLDPYPLQTPAVDVWQLGMMALDLADGPVPTTWLKQREPTPRLNPYPWSSYFQSFVASCLQLNPEERASAEELLRHPWFTVALVPQVTGGYRGAREGPQLQQRFSAVPPPSSSSLLPPPRVSCVMGVDCLTKEEAAEWEAYDYTALYANGETAHSLTASPTTTAAAAAATSESASVLGRPRRPSANSALAAVDGSGSNTTGTAAPGGSTAVFGGASGVDIGAASLSLGISGVNSLSVASGGRNGASTAHHHSALNPSVIAAGGSSGSAALTSALDAGYSALSSVDLAQYFTRLASLQWRRQQHPQIGVPMLASSFVGPNNFRGSIVGSAGGGGGWGSFVFPPGSTGVDPRGLGSGGVVAPPFLDASLPFTADDAWALLRQSTAGTRYLQGVSPRQALYGVLSPRPPSTSASLGAPSAQQQSQQQAESGGLAPQLWAIGPGGSINGTPYVLPSALSGFGNTAPSPRLLTSARPGIQSDTPPPPLTQQSANVKMGLPSTYVPLRDPRVGGAAALPAPPPPPPPFPATQASNASVSPRWTGTAAENLAAASLQASQRAQSPPIFLPSARDARPRLNAGGVDDPRPLGLEKLDAHWGDFSDVEERVEALDVCGGSVSTSTSDGSSSRSDDEGGDGGVSVEEHSSCSSSSGRPTFGRAGRASSGGHSSSQSRSFLSSLDDSAKAHRGGGEVPSRNSATLPHDATEGRVAVEAALSAMHFIGSGQADGKAAGPPGMPAFSPFHTVSPPSSTMKHSSGGGRGLAPAHSNGPLTVHDGVSERHRYARRVARPRLRHLLLGTIATSLARLSTLVESGSDSDDWDSSEDSGSSRDFCGDNSVSSSVGSSNGSPRGLAVHRRRGTQNFHELTSQGSTAARRHASNPITADNNDGDGDRQHAQHHSGVRVDSLSSARSPFTPLSSLPPHVHLGIRSNAPSSPSASDARSNSSSSDDDDSDDDPEDSVEVQCDEVLRCFSALQRACPMGVSLWCVRMLQQAELHPRTAACASRLMERVERGAIACGEARRLSWLAPRQAISASSDDGGRDDGDEQLTTDSTAHTTAENAADEAVNAAPATPAPTPPPVLDTCPTSFHNYELARWLYAAHQTIPRCS